VLEVLGREGHRDAHHPHPLALLPEETPESVAMLVVDGDRPRHGEQTGRRHACTDAGGDRQNYGDAGGDGPAQAEDLEDEQEEERHGGGRDQAHEQPVVLAEEEGLLTRLTRGEVGPVGRGIALQEVEDAVPARVEAGRKGGPGDRRLRRNGRQQR
jgi:hypothetical protein